jgi:hypothetical protein
MRRTLTIVGLVLSIAGIAWVAHAWTSWRVTESTSRFNQDVENLFIGLQQYKEHVGTYPSGGNAEIAKSLMGQNSKNVFILVGRKSDLNSKGEFVDPWGQPLRFYFSTTGVLIRSAGPNRRFDDSTSLVADDIIRSN